MKQTIRPILTMIAALLVIVASTPAQWTRTSGPEGGNIRSLVYHPSGLLALLQSEELYRYSDVDGEWRPVRSLSAYNMVAVGDTLIADSPGGMIRSLDGGTTWESLGANGFIWILGVQGSSIYALNANLTILRSTDGGTTWKTYAKLGVDVDAIASNGSVAWVGVYGESGVLRSTNDGETWSHLDNGFPKNGTPWRLYYQDKALYASVLATEPLRSLGVYRSDDSGSHWYPINDGLAAADRSLPVTYGFYPHGSDVAATTSDGVYQRVGSRWQKTVPSFVSSVALGQSGDLFLGTPAGVIWNNAETWGEMNNGLVASDINDLLTHDETILAAGNDGAYRTSDRGATWRRTLRGATTALARAHDVVYALQTRSIGGEIHTSTDDGETWQPSSSGIEHPEAATSIAVGSAGAFIGLYDVRAADDGEHGVEWRAGGVHRTTDGGRSWVPVNNGLPHRGSIAAPVTHLAAIDRTLLALTPSGLFRSTDDGDHWEETAIDRKFYPLTTIACHQGEFFAAAVRRVLRSTDLGATWRVVDPHDSLRASIERFYSLGTRLLGREVNASPSAYIYLLDGDDWHTVNDQLPTGITLSSFATMGDRVILGTLGAAVWVGRMESVAGVDDHQPALPGTAAFAPNPVTERGVVTYHLPRHGPATLRIVDALGVSTAIHYLGRGDAGVNRSEIDVSSLPPGAYSFSIESDGHVTTGRFVRVHH